MAFPPFEHARFLGDAQGATHNLGSSAFAPPPWAERGLPPVERYFDSADLHLVAEPRFRAATADHLGVAEATVEATAGTTGANLAVLLHAVRPGTNVVVERPYYQPLPGVAQGLGAEVRLVERRSDDAWRLDAGDVAEACDADTALIILASPNNPTGAAASREDLLALAAVADEVDALVLVDQVYRELTDHALAAPLHPRLVSTGGFNKSWGAAALRTGWLVAEPGLAATLGEIHRQAALAPPPWGTHLARALLNHEAPARRLLEQRLQATHPIYNAWLAESDLRDAADNRPPPWGLTAFPEIGGDTTALAHRLLEQDILVIPGEYFGWPGRVRIGLGGDPDKLAAGLQAFNGALATRRAGAAQY